MTAVLPILTERSPLFSAQQAGIHAEKALKALAAHSADFQGIYPDMSADLLLIEGGARE